MVAESADLSAGVFGSPEQLRNFEETSRRNILLLDAIGTAFLSHMLAQQLSAFGIEDANEELVPLHLDHTADPAGRKAVVGGFDFHAAIQMHYTLAVLVITKWFEWQRK